MFPCLAVKNAVKKNTLFVEKEDFSLQRDRFQIPQWGFRECHYKAFPVRCNAVGTYSLA